MKTKSTAVVVLAFNRPDHVKRLMGTLEQNAEFPELPILAFVDGPRNEHDQWLIEEVVNVLTTARPDALVIQQTSNLGVAKSVTGAVTAALDSYDRVIVVEDDLEVSPYFLRFMTEGLETYEKDPRVISIHGYTIPMKNIPTSTYFLRGSDCWGWATWRRAWKHYRNDAGQMIRELRDNDPKNGFTFSRSSNHLELLQLADAGEIDSWAIRWHAATYLWGGLTLHPSRTLVRNGGMDGSGRHSGSTEIYDSELADGPIRVEEGPAEPCALAYREYKKFYRRRSRSKRVRKAKTVLDQIIKNLRTAPQRNRTKT